jgi:hypothetical protein
MKVLVACEESQIITKAFTERGHNAMSCDKYYPGALGFPHYKGDVRDLLDEYYDLVIFHPVCKFIANSGVKHLHTDISRWFRLYEACQFFNLRHKFNSPRVVTENPIPHKYAVGYIGQYDQTYQPWHHGHREIKATCLWLKGVEPLKPSNIVGPPPPNRDKKEWDKVHRCSPGPDRERIRSRTLEGVAKAMADQWGIGNLSD